MRNPAEAIKPDEIIKIILRRRWYIIIPFCLSMMIGIYYALTLPKVYSAETLILLQPQRISANYVQSLVSVDLDSRINTLSQQILSRTNLEKIIYEFKLYSGPNSENMFMEDKIGSMRKRIVVDVTRSRRNTNAFSISFKGKDPEKIMRVTNALANYFIGENLKTREAQAIGTSDFLEDELSTMRKRLEEVEQALKNYREAYMGGLPEQLESNLRILDRMQEQLIERRQNITDAKNRIIVIENEISQGQGLQPTGEIGTGDTLNIDQLHAQLKQLRSRYTDQHPDIVSLKERIADLEKEPLSPLQSPVRNRQIADIKREISTLEGEISDIRKQVYIYEVRVEETPNREQELLSLRRDYDNINETYNSLLERKLEAELAVNLERKQQGEQFRILDPAKRPERPSDPDMKKLFLIFIAAGLGIGGGVVFLLEYLDTSFRIPNDIESYLGLSVLATVPVILHPRDVRMKRLNQALSIFFVIVAFALMAGFTLVSLGGYDLASFRGIA
ncbi:MAG: protein GumC [Deltaproteobacteria bacterium]|nr:protein GumC [Deltaproteobacteria bacterium]